MCVVDNHAGLSPMRMPTISARMNWHSALQPPPAFIDIAEEATVAFWNYRFIHRGSLAHSS